MLDHVFALTGLWSGTTWWCSPLTCGRACGGESEEEARGGSRAAPWTVQDGLTAVSGGLGFQHRFLGPLPDAPALPRQIVGGLLAQPGISPAPARRFQLQGQRH